MTSWEERAWRLSAGRSRVGGSEPAVEIPPLEWEASSGEAAALFALAGLLPSDGVEGPFMSATCPTAPCPVCGGPTANGWWVRDDDIGEWCKVTFPPTPCTRCRAVVLSSAVRDGE